jgi:hypothetical protein
MINSVMNPIEGINLKKWRIGSQNFLNIVKLPMHMPIGSPIQLPKNHPNKILRKLTKTDSIKFPFARSSFNPSITLKGAGKKSGDEK